MWWLFIEIIEILDKITLTDEDKYFEKLVLYTAQAFFLTVGSLSAVSACD